MDAAADTARGERGSGRAFEVLGTPVHDAAELHRGLVPSVLIPPATMPPQLLASLAQLLGVEPGTAVARRRYNLTWSCRGRYLKLQAWRGHGEERCADVRCLCHEHAMTLLAAASSLRPEHRIQSLAEDLTIVTLAVAGLGVDTETLMEQGRAVDVEQMVVDVTNKLAGLALAGLRHLDVCPSNIVLGEQGYSLIDYGAARTLDHALVHGFDDIAYWNRHHGSPVYLCQVWLGGDPRNEDLWALTACAYHHLAGRPLLADTFSTAELRDSVRLARSDPGQGRAQVADALTRRALLVFRTEVSP